jgi:hypothetical protein
MTPSDDIRKRLHHIMNAQRCGGPEVGLTKVTTFLLTGFYLEESDVDAIESLLEPPDPELASPGELGRYRGVPVYPRWYAAEEEVRPDGRYGGVLFGYVEMLHVLMAPIPE